MSTVYWKCRWGGDYYRWYMGGNMKKDSDKGRNVKQNKERQEIKGKIEVKSLIKCKMMGNKGKELDEE
jgi:hypothetical protein